MGELCRRRVRPPIDALLALDAIPRPWHCVQAPRFDRILAALADAVTAVVDARQRRFDFAQQLRMTVERHHGELALRRQNDALAGLRSLLDGNEPSVA